MIKKLLLFFMFISTLSLGLFSQVDYDIKKSYKLHTHHKASRIIKTDEIFENDTLLLYANATIVVDSILNIKEIKINYLKLNDAKTNKVLFQVNTVDFDRVKTFILSEKILSYIIEYFTSIEFELELLDRNFKFMGEIMSISTKFNIIGKKKINSAVINTRL